MSERSSGWSGSIPTITFQWCFSQSATISSPLGIVRTRTTAGRLSDPNFAILDSPCEYRIPAYRLALGSAICMVSRECSILRSIHWSTLEPLLRRGLAAHLLPPSPAAVLRAALHPACIADLPVGSGLVLGILVLAGQRARTHPAGLPERPPCPAQSPSRFFNPLLA